jgi:mRNA interferase RelE/StbE
MTQHGSASVALTSAATSSSVTATYKYSYGSKIPKIALAIDELIQEPTPHGCKKLKGEKEYLWRIRVGDYRIIYLIEDSIQIIEIRKIGHRKDVYL